MSIGSVKTNSMMQAMLNGHFLSTSTPPTKMKIGINSTTPSPSDTSLGSQIPVFTTESVDDCEATTGWSAGTDSAVSLNSTTFKEGSGSLSLAKSGTSGTVMSVSKTTTSVDFTSKTFHCWIYLTALSDLVSSGTAITIRFGSDSSNYYYYNIDISSLSSGWNYVGFSTATASGTTGSPTVTACDYSYLAFNTDLAADTIAADRILYDDLIVASSDDYDLDFISGYPVVTVGELKAETKTIVGTTSGNGFSVTETGEFTSDNTMQSHHVFDDESKSNTDIFYFVETTKIRLQS